MLAKAISKNRELEELMEDITAQLPRKRPRESPPAGQAVHWVG